MALKKMIVIVLMGTRAAVYENIFSNYVKSMILLQINGT